MDSRHDNPHEYLFWQRGLSKVVRNKKWKLMMNDKSDENILYNLMTNKYENPDESDVYPEVVNELQEVYSDWTKTHHKPMWPAVIYFTTEKDGKKYSFEQ